MTRRGVALLAAAAILFGGCSSAAAEPTWTFSPAEDAAAVASPSPTPEPTPAPTPVPTASPTPTPEPTPAPGTLESPREIEVVMGNFFYEPASFSVRAGETIRFVIHNPTEIPHELVIGDAEEQEHHAAEMAAGMDHGHDPGAGGHDDGPNDGHQDDPMAAMNALEVAAGASAELVWTFDEAGEIFMACHLPGHYDAGMQGAIEVS